MLGIAGLELLETINVGQAQAIQLISLDLLKFLRAITPCAAIQVS